MIIIVQDLNVLLSAASTFTAPKEWVGPRVYTISEIMCFYNELQQCWVNMFRLYRKHPVIGNNVQVQRALRLIYSLVLYVLLPIRRKDNWMPTLNKIIIHCYDILFPIMWGCLSLWVRSVIAPYILIMMKSVRFSIDRRNFISADLLANFINSIYVGIHNPNTI